MSEHVSAKFPTADRIWDLLCPCWSGLFKSSEGCSAGNLGGSGLLLKKHAQRSQHDPRSTNPSLPSSPSNAEAGTAFLAGLMAATG